MTYGETKRLRPDRIVPDADGGVVFEEVSVDATRTLHIWNDMSSEYYSVQDGRIVERFPVTLMQLEFCETPTTLREIAKKHGMDFDAVEDQQEQLDLKTGKRFTADE